METENKVIPAKLGDLAFVEKTPSENPHEKILRLIGQISALQIQILGLKNQVNSIVSQAVRDLDEVKETLK